MSVTLHVFHPGNNEFLSNLHFFAVRTVATITVMILNVTHSKAVKSAMKHIVLIVAVQTSWMSMTGSVYRVTTRWIPVHSFARVTTNIYLTHLLSLILSNFKTLHIM